MELSIISPLQKKTFNIAWIEINTPVGSFVIQPGHSPMIIGLAQNKTITFCLMNGKQESFIVEHGFIEITKTAATVLLNK